MRFISLVFTALIALTASYAHADGSKEGFRYGLDLGGIGLLGDLNSQGSRFSAGFGVGYQLASPWSLELDYMAASFDDVDHRDIDLGCAYLLPGDEYQAHVAAGVSFLHNDIKLSSRSGDAVGAYLGTGMSWAMTEKVRLGFDARLHLVNPTKATVSGVEVATVSNSFSLMAKLTYYPDFSD